MFCKAEVEGHIGLFAGLANHFHMFVLLAHIMEQDSLVKVFIFLNVNPFQKPWSLQDRLPLPKGRCKQD